MWRKTVEKVAEATFWANLCMNFDIFIYGEKILDKVFFMTKKASLLCDKSEGGGFIRLTQFLKSFVEN